MDPPLNVSIDIQVPCENDGLIEDVDVDVVPPERIPYPRLPCIPCLMISLMGGLCFCLTFLLFLYCYFHSGIY